MFITILNIFFIPYNNYIKISYFKVSCFSFINSKGHLLYFSKLFFRPEHKVSFACYSILV